MIIHVGAHSFLFENRQQSNVLDQIHLYTTQPLLRAIGYLLLTYLFLLELVLSIKSLPRRRFMINYEYAVYLDSTQSKKKKPENVFTAKYSLFKTQ